MQRGASDINRASHSLLSLVSWPSGFLAESIEKDELNGNIINSLDAYVRTAPLSGSSQVCEILRNISHFMMLKGYVCGELDGR